MKLSELSPYLNNLKKSGNQFRAECPICNDPDHLAVKETEGKVLINCLKCSAGFADVVKTLKIPYEKPEEFTDKLEIIEKYDHEYKNYDGSISYFKTRTKFSNGSKKFTFWHNDNGVKKWTKPENCPALYNLDQLYNADRTEVLYIVEGEKCVDILKKNGMLATTTNTGAGGKLNLSKKELELLNEFPAKIVIPDNDEAGLKYAQNFYDAKILNLSEVWSEIGKKQDIYDFITLGKDLNLIKNYKFKFEKPIGELTKDELMEKGLFKRILSIPNRLEQIQFLTRVENRAKELKFYKGFNDNFQAYKGEIRRSVESAAGLKTEFIGQPIELNCGEWVAKNHRVVMPKISQKGDTYEEIASPIPVLPTEILFNADSGVEKIKLEFYKDGWKSVICERATTASSNKIIDLANKGLEVNSENSKLLVKYIADCVALNLETLPRYNSISRLGWVEKNFMPYSDNIKFDGEKENKYLFEAICQKGDLEEWVDFVKPLRENLYLRLQMAASLASPLIEKVNALPFVFHLWGGAGSGKTVGLMVAGSIWGSPKMGKMVRTMNMTANSMLSTASFLHNVPFMGDELQTIKSKYDNDYDPLIMKITEGIDRGRMSYNKNEESKTWKCAFLFTGEEPCTKSHSGGGVKNRVIEIECVTPVVENGNQVVNFINDHYGNAGIKFIELIADKNHLKEYEAIFKKIMEQTETTEKQAMAMALMILGDQIASKGIFKDEKPLTLDDVREFLKTAEEADITERAYLDIVDWIAINKNKFGSSVVGEYWGGLDYDSDCIYIVKSILEKKLNEFGTDFDVVKKKWAAAGYLEKNSQGRFAHQTTQNNQKATFVKICLR